MVNFGFFLGFMNNSFQTKYIVHAFFKSRIRAMCCIPENNKKEKKLSLTFQFNATLQTYLMVGVVRERYESSIQTISMENEVLFIF